MRLLYSLQAFSFWGILFLIISVIGFGVKITDIVSIAFSLEMYLSAFCWYMLLSVIIFPLLFFLTSHWVLKKDLGFDDIISVDLPRTFWIPYQGLNLHELFHLKETGMDMSGILHDIGIHIQWIIEMIIWWGIVILGIHTIRCQGDNAFLTAFESKTSMQRLIILGIILLIYALCVVIGVLLRRASGRKWRKKGFIRQ